MTIVRSFSRNVMKNKIHEEAACIEPGHISQAYIVLKIRW